LAGSTCAGRFAPSNAAFDEGLNVIEHWNSANDFIFSARRGEFASNRREDHEISCSLCIFFKIA
jgi:hypothetical protein